MSELLRPRSLPDHGTPAGDAVRVQIVIKVHASGALSIEGPLEERAWMLAALENAKDAVRNHRPRELGLIVPPSDVSL